MLPNCSSKSVRDLTISVVGASSGVSWSLFWLFLEGLRAPILKEEEEKAINGVNGLDLCPEEYTFKNGV